MARASIAPTWHPAIKQIPQCLRQNSSQGKPPYSRCCSLRPCIFSPHILGELLVMPHNLVSRSPLKKGEYICHDSLIVPHSSPPAPARPRPGAARSPCPCRGP